jgi:hypothetical protein
VKQEEDEGGIYGNLAESNTRDFHALCVKSAHPKIGNPQIPAINQAA